MLPLDTERVFGAGPFIVDNYSVNYLFGLDQMCQKYVKKDFVVLELGVRDGISTSVFAHYAHTVIAVDKSIARRRSRRHKILNDNNNIIFYLQTFDNFFLNNKIKFDLIYIDGNHGYRHIKNDIYNSLQHIKPNGIISGHDHHSQNPGVITAVNEFFNNDIEIFSDSSWLKCL